MSKEQDGPEDFFTPYVGHYPKEGDNTPFVTMWVNVSEDTISDTRNEDGPYTGYREDTESLEDCGVCIGPYLGRSYNDRSRALTEEHLGFMPVIDDRVFMVIEDYASGGTFGRTNHNFNPVKIFKTRNDALAWTQTPEAERYKNDDYFGGHNEYLIKKVEVE